MLSSTGNSSLKKLNWVSNWNKQGYLEEMKFTVRCWVTEQEMKRRDSSAFPVMWRHSYFLISPFMQKYKNKINCLYSYSLIIYSLDRCVIAQINHLYSRCRRPILTKSMSGCECREGWRTRHFTVTLDVTEFRCNIAMEMYFLFLW